MRNTKQTNFHPPGAQHDTSGTLATCIGPTTTTTTTTLTLATNATG